MKKKAPEKKAQQQKELASGAKKAPSQSQKMQQSTSSGKK